MLLFDRAKDDRDKIVSGLTQVESTSAINRMQMRKLINPDETALALGALARKMSRMRVQAVDSSVLAAATALVIRHHLRALDAVQLGTATVARDRLTATDMRFIASDKELLDAARAEGFAIWDPAV